MTFKNRDAEIPMARCSECDADLIASKANGKIFCSNMSCKYVRTAHPMSSEPSAGTSSLND